MKATYTHKPQQFQRDNDGTSVFRWDISETVTDDGDTHYECYECRVHVTPTARNIKKTAIEARWPIDIEAKLVNDNMASIVETGQPTDAYRDFLNERQAIKDAVDECLADR